MNSYRTYDWGRVYQGDSFQLMEDLIQGGRKFPLQIHDPPYEVSAPNVSRSNGGGDLVLDFGEWDKLPDLEKMVKLWTGVASEDASILVFFNNWDEYSSLKKLLNQEGWKVDALVWTKTNPAPQVRRRSYVTAFELILWARRGTYTFNFTQHTEMFSWRSSPIAMGHVRLKGADGKTLHPTQKPVKLIESYIRDLSNPGDEVLDCFAGALTTAAACILQGRKFIVCEQEEKYVKLGCEWLEDLQEKNRSLKPT